MAAPMSTCEHPQFPHNWMWRFNRNKHLSRFEPWYTRAERWPPRYRRMGMHDNFLFRDTVDSIEMDRLAACLDTEGEGPKVKLGVNIAHHLGLNRTMGSGNGALGNPPGPAPPRLVLTEHSLSLPKDDLYPQQAVVPLTDGYTPHDNTHIKPINYDRSQMRLDPPHYLQETLNQRVEFPGTFPYMNKAFPSLGPRPERESLGQASAVPRNPLAVWQDKHKADLAGHALEEAHGCHRSMVPRFGNGKWTALVEEQAMLQQAPPAHCGAGIRCCLAAQEKDFKLIT